MAKYLIKAYTDAANIHILRKKLETAGVLLDAVQLEKLSKTPTKAERIEEAEGLIQEAKGILEDVVSEVDEALSNLPENLSNSSKAEQMQTMKDELENQMANIDQIDFSGVEY
jgi:histidinol dehydrogenase